MPSGRPWLRKIAMLLAITGAGSVAASESRPPSASAWTADPETQFLLDVRIRQLRLADGVRAYQTPEGTCVLFGDFIASLDVPIAVDLSAKKASGWAFSEQNRIAIDLAAGTVQYRDQREPLAQGTIRETPEGWCADAGALARWFGIGVKPVTSASLVLLESKAKLPVELAIERGRRAAAFKGRAKFDIASLPQVKLPYRMWRAPALDFVVSAGATYRARDGVQVDRRTSILAAGEIAHVSYDAQISTDRGGALSNLRVRAYRSDPEGGLLGPLRATHFALGDVESLDSLSGALASGRGAMVTNRPLFTQPVFNRKRFEGELPAGWDAEIYRNDELLGFAKPTPDQRYLFEDVQLLYGENRVRIVLYGPQGQIRTREELINVGQDNVPPGKTWYWAGFNQPAQEVVRLGKPPDRSALPRAQAAVSLEHGVDDRTSVGALARMMLIGDERLTFVEGTVRRSIGSALIEVGAARESSGGTAARAQLLAKFGNVNVSAEALAANDFRLRGNERVSRRDLKLLVDAPIRIGRKLLLGHADVRLSDNQDGSRALEAAARLAANVDRFNLATGLSYRQRYVRSGAKPPGELDLGLIGSGRLGDVRLRAATNLAVSPRAHLRSAELSAYWSVTERVDWEGALAFDAAARRARARVTHVRRLSSMALALSAEAATDGSLAAGLNLSFSLDPSHGFRLSRQPLAAAGAIHARVYRDVNDNGVRDAGEPLEKDALITTGSRLAERPTGGDGSVLVGGLSAFVPVTVGLDETSLADPMLVPKKAMQVVVPRPGVPAEVEIGLVGGGDIEGAILKNGELGFEGLDLELVDAAGKVVATARTDFDGFFLFERVPYGRYRVRVAKEAAQTAGLFADLNVTAEVSAAKSVVRLGAIHVRAAPQIASSE